MPLSTTASSSRRPGSSVREFDDHGRCGRFPAGGFGPHRNFNVLAQGIEELEEALNGKMPGAPVHQCRNVRLLDSEYLTGLSLGQPAPPDKPVDLQREISLQCLPLGMRKAQIGKNIAAALTHNGICFLSPHSSIRIYV